MSFRLGCAIWAYKEWVGESAGSLFPVGSRATDFLHLYSRRFSTVEGNTTFYSIPDAATVQRWVAETPASFKFCLKLPRDVTHQGLLTPAIPQAIAFLEQVQGLGDRLGPFFAQLPPSYSPDRLDDLRCFLTALPRRRFQFALEVRHLDWFKEPHVRELNAMLTDLGVGRVLLDTRPIYDCPDNPQIASERRKPQLPLQPVVTASFSLVRYISHPNQDLNQRYLLEWTQQIDLWIQQGIQIYFFVHCPIEVHSPGNARYLQLLLEEQGVSVPPLPWNALESPPTQLSLF
ncbi:MAG: DUF72 domain-containing protein [Drouetiella hepatica Uher 2000/2452]|jgi:uncharacterized protein YecE (DUF72 family)|uniref:DUF72 domain-containing protein n=1 Tax=Drouetiella hepatica Uher 2000/2452 TaxID=904376 RepID=A0A951QFU3_9CYAN|nr:DUF72 domain-containing protein [Drouetiella hepatica Uher 2000/2452]